MTAPGWLSGHAPFASGYVRDLASRVGKTFVQAFMGQVAIGNVIGVHKVVLLSNLDRGAIAGGASVGSLIFGLLARWASTDKANAAFTGPATTPPPAAGAAH